MRFTNLKRIFLLSISFWICAYSTNCFSQVPHIPESLDFYYLFYKVTNRSLPYEEFAGTYKAYASAKDEFAKRDILQKLKPRIEAEFKSVAAHSEFLMLHNTTLGKYNFDRKVFPMDEFSHGFYAQFGYRPMSGPPIALLFSNGRVLENWPIAQDDARQVLNKLGDNRNVQVGIEFRLVSGEDRRLGERNTRALIAEITRVRLKTVDGAVTLGGYVPTAEMAKAPADPCEKAKDYVTCRLQQRIDSARDCVRKHGYSACGGK